MSRDFYLKLFKTLTLFCLLLLGLRFSGGYFAYLILLGGLGAAFIGKTGMAINCFIFFPVAICVNIFLVPPSTSMLLCTRLGDLALGLVISLVIKTKNKCKIPLSALTGYCVVMCFSSAVGYCPNVSYMKLIYFSLFVFCVASVANRIGGNMGIIEQIRTTFLSFCVFYLVGSLLTLPFPAIAYPSTSSWLLKGGADLAEANLMMQSKDNGMLLLAGVTMHSQMLAPILTMVLFFLLSDMLFYVRKITWFHSTLILATLIFAYMTRSRTALFSMTVTVFTIYFIILPRIRMHPRVKSAIKTIGRFFLIFVLVGGVFAEIKGGFLSNWLFKGEDKSQDVVTAVTSTRMGSVETQLLDFWKNPLVGCGFQVNADSARFRNAGFILSAPVEKGLLPMIILGEGGLLGVLAFIIFIFTFYAVCVRQRFYVLATGFTSFLASNIGEGTFFSPGGVGGVLWLFSVVGGFTLDMLVGLKDREGMYAYKMD